MDESLIGDRVAVFPLLTGEPLLVYPPLALIQAEKENGEGKEGKQCLKIICSCIA